jgi:ABC-type lipoprotein export system ATPase subunit
MTLAFEHSGDDAKRASRADQRTDNRRQGRTNFLLRRAGYVFQFFNVIPSLTPFMLSRQPG